MFRLARLIIDFIKYGQVAFYKRNRNGQWTKVGYVKVLIKNPGENAHANGGLPDVAKNGRQVRWNDKAD